MEGQVWWDMPVIPAPLESETEDQDLRPAQANVWDTIWECKVKAEGVWFKWVEHLPGYLKAWGSMPSTAKKKKMQCDLEKIELSCWQWLMPVILATKEEETRRFVVQSQQGQIVHETLS
jgi:hypothetical protein